MGWLFRDGDSKTAKFVTLALMVPVGVALVGLLDRHNLVPSSSWLVPAAVVGGLVAGGTLVALVKDQSPVSLYARFGPFKRLGALAIILPFAWSQGFFAVWLGVPSIWASVALDPKESTAVVTHVLRERSGRGCHHMIRIEGGPLPEAITPCVSKELGESLKAGEVVAITYVNVANAFVIRDIAQLK